MPSEQENSVSDIASVPVALLAGGLATRLQPMTQTLPKALVEVAGRPFIDHQLDLLHRHGIRKVVLCVGHLGQMLAEHLGNGADLGMDLQYAYDGGKLLGTGGAIRAAAQLLDDVFWVVYGDSYMDIDYRAVLESFSRKSAQGLMTVLRNDNRWDKSNVLFEDGRLIRYDKRQPTADMRHIDYGVGLLRRSALTPIPTGEAYDLADLSSQMVAAGQMVGYEVFNRFYEIGTPRALEEAQAYFMSKAGGG